MTNGTAKQQTEVRVHQKYGLQHKHPGIGYWHMASKRHSEPFHEKANAANPKGLEKLTAAQRKTYAAALEGVMTPEAKAYYAHAAELAKKRAAAEEGTERVNEMAELEALVGESMSSRA